MRWKVYLEISSISIADAVMAEAVPKLYTKYNHRYIFAVVTAAVKMVKRVSRRARDKYQTVYYVR